MVLVDSENLRELLARLLPGLQIAGVAKRSGQRLVYFARFSSTGLPLDLPEDLQRVTETREAWGEVVVRVSAGLRPNEISYLQREIRLLTELETPSFPKLYANDVFTADPDSDRRLDSSLFVTIEQRVDGVPLSQRRNMYRDEPAVEVLLLQLVRALRLLWEQRPSIVHRDIKPDNVLVKNDGDLVVIDLGIAREQGADGVTVSGALWGPCTPQYSSPEQAQNDKRNITFKSDFFSLGTVAYELLTGRNPFNSASGMRVTEILENVITLEVEPLHRVAGVSQQFSDLIQMMMEKQPYKRPRSPELLERELQTLLGANHNGR